MPLVVLVVVVVEPVLPDAPEDEPDPLVELPEPLSVVEDEPELPEPELSAVVEDEPELSVVDDPDPLLEPPLSVDVEPEPFSSCFALVSSGFAGVPLSWSPVVWSVASSSVTVVVWAVVVPMPLPCVATETIAA